MIVRLTDPASEDVDSPHEARLQEFLSSSALHMSSDDAIDCADALEFLIERGRRCKSEEQLRTTSKIYFCLLRYTLRRDFLTKLAETQTENGVQHSCVSNVINLADLNSVAYSESQGAGSSMLKSIVTNSESAVGQAVLRDIVLSLTMPLELSLSHTRTSALLQRAQNQVLSSSALYQSHQNRAHSIAMNGPTDSYAVERDELSRMAALLTAMTIQLSAAAGNDHAFAGRVDAPFLKSFDLVAGQRRLFLHGRQVFCYEQSKKRIRGAQDAGIRLLSYGTGFTALEVACSLILESI
jgi:hypothetical protein